MSQWSEKIPKENLSETVSSTRYLFTSFRIQTNNFRKSSKKFIIDLLTKNVALNLSGAIFFVGLGYSLKWRYKDQLFVVLLKQNLPALSESQQNISWETGEPIYTYPLPLEGMGKLNDEDQTWTSHSEGKLIDRIDLYANHMCVKFKQPWQKHIYERFIGVFGEPAQANVSKQVLITKDKDRLQENTSVINNYLSDELQKNTVNRTPFYLSPFNIININAGTSGKEKIEGKKINNFARSLASSKGVSNVINKFSTYTFYTPEKSIFPKKWFKLSPRNLYFLNQEVILPLLGTKKRNSFNKFSKTWAPYVQSKEGVNAIVKPRYPRFGKFTKGAYLTEESVTGWGSWRSKAEEHRDKKTSLDKLSYPLQLTKKFASWQPSPNLLVLNSYLDEIPYKLENTLQSYFPKQDSQLLFLSTSFREFINSHVAMFNSTRTHSCENIRNDTVIKSDSVNTVLCKGSDSDPQSEALQPSVLQTHTQRAFPLRDNARIFARVNPNYLPQRGLLDKSDKSKICTIWNSPLGYWQSKATDFLPLQGIGVTGTKRWKGSQSWVSNSFGNYKSSEIENNKTQKTLDLFNETTHFVPTNILEEDSIDSIGRNVLVSTKPSETYLKKLHLFETKKLLQNQFALLINSFPIDFIEKSEAFIEKDKHSDTGDKVINNVSNYHHLINVTKKVLALKTNIQKGVILPPSLQDQYAQSKDGAGALTPTESVAEMYWGTEVDRLTQLFAYSTVANTADAEGLDPLLLLNTLGFTFNNFSPLTNPPILLSYDKLGVISNGVTNMSKSRRDCNSATVQILNFAPKESKTEDSISSLLHKEEAKLCKLLCVTKKPQKSIFDLYKSISFYFNPKNLNWIVFQHSTNDKFNRLFKKIESEINKDVTRFNSCNSTNPLSLQGIGVGDDEVINFKVIDLIASNQSITTQLTHLMFEFLKGKRGLSYVHPFGLEKDFSTLLLNNNKGVFPLRDQIYSKREKNLHDLPLYSVTDSVRVKTQKGATEDFIPSLLHKEESVVEKSKAKKLIDLIKRNTVINKVDTTSKNVNKIPGRVSFKQKETKFETLNKINVVDKDINFDKNSRCMSGYVYPDIQSKSLKAFLYQWLSNNKNWMPWFSFHYLNDKPIAFYSKNLQNCVNLSATDSVGVTTFPGTQSKEGLAEPKIEKLHFRGQKQGKGMGYRTFMPHFSVPQELEIAEVKSKPFLTFVHKKVEPEKSNFKFHHRIVNILDKACLAGGEISIKGTTLGTATHTLFDSSHTPPLSFDLVEVNSLHPLKLAKREEIFTPNQLCKAKPLIKFAPKELEVIPHTQKVNQKLLLTPVQILDPSLHDIEDVSPFGSAKHRTYLNNSQYLSAGVKALWGLPNWQIKEGVLSQYNPKYLPQEGIQNTEAQLRGQKQKDEKLIPQRGNSYASSLANLAKRKYQDLLEEELITEQPEAEDYAKYEYNVYPYGISSSLIVSKKKNGFLPRNDKVINLNQFLENSHYMDNIEVPYKKFNHYLAKFPGFFDPNQFFTTLPQISSGNKNLVNNSLLRKEKESQEELYKESTLDELLIPLDAPQYGKEAQLRNTEAKERKKTFETEKKTKKLSFVREEVNRQNDSINIVDNSEINKKFIQKNGCDSRKVAYSGIVVRRNKLTKDFQPFISNKNFKKFTNLRFVPDGASKSSIWGTLFLGPENPLTDRQCHFFGQKQLSTLDTNSLQRDYLRQLGKEILTQSNSKGYTELSKFSSIERTKILSLSKKVNSFFFKKRKYSYLLEPKDQWHLLFQEQLCTALEDCKKYPLSTSTIYSFEETNIEKLKLGSGRIKVSAPLVMARFPKKLVQTRSIHNKLANYQLEQGISWRPVCHLQRSLIYVPLKDKDLPPAIASENPSAIAKENPHPIARGNHSYHISYNTNKSVICTCPSSPVFTPALMATHVWAFTPSLLTPTYPKGVWYAKQCTSAAGGLVEQVRYPHYPLFTERFSEEINTVPYLNKNSLFYSATDSVKVKAPRGTKNMRKTVQIKDLYRINSCASKRINSKRNNLLGIQNMCTSLLIQEPLNCNSWAVLNQWVFLLALLFWVEQTLLNNVLPALFALEQILLSAAGLRTGENNRTHVLRISKNETPKFQNLAGIDGLLGELSELVLFLRGQGNQGIAKLSFWKKWNKKNSYGVLLTGSPGTGKTFLVRALANEAKVPVLILSASTLTASKLNNNKPSWSIRHAFKRAKQLAPCILFIDEIDALGKSRGKIVTDINEIVVDTNLTSLNASFLTHKRMLTTSTHVSHNSASPIAQQMFSYEQFGQNYSNFNATLLNKWEYPLQSTILQESNEINQNSLCQEKLVDLLKIAGGSTSATAGGTHAVQDYNRGAFTPITSLSAKESAAEFKKESTNETPYSRSDKGVQQTLEKEMTRDKFGPLTQLLVSMDGVSSFSGVLIMGATNRPELLDPALTRPGRFEKIIRIDKPSEQNRIEILQLYSQNLGIQQQIPWSYLATRTIGLTTADLAVAMNYSSLRAIIQDSVHTLETIEYGLNCITRL